ncbi:uncharacterized protein G2W53_017699 [Senna tora]|uniref:Uncharacterized protein n=1 Tax=Senna tora TaxID=362788 RepID=A0A834WKE8_9FABA|nr:uncharacterized protein G2W53_017699 [Senna tora]
MDHLKGNGPGMLSLLICDQKEDALLLKKRAIYDI